MDTKLRFIIEADASSGTATVRKFGTELERTGDAAEKGATRGVAAFERFGQTLRTFATIAATAAGAALIGIGVKATKMAVAAVESENLFSVSMGRMAEAARAWSMELNKSLGLNQYELRRNVGMFNVMFTAMGLGEQAAFDMAKGLTQLAYDFASFYDLRPEEAFEKLRSGISGEIEPLKRLGIVVDEQTTKNYALKAGIAGAGEEMTQAQKVLARYGAIMEQTSAAQGDLARTIDSPANAMRVLGTRVDELLTVLGQSFLPTLQTVVGILGDFVASLQASQSAVASIAKVLAAPIGVFYRLAAVMNEFKMEYLEFQRDMLQGLRNSWAAMGGSTETADRNIREITKSIHTAADKAVYWQTKLVSLDESLKAVGKSAADTAKAGSSAGGSGGIFDDQSWKKTDRNLREAYSSTESWRRLIDALAGSWEYVQTKIEDAGRSTKEILADLEQLRPRSEVGFETKSAAQAAKEALEPGIVGELGKPARQVRDEWGKQISTIVTDWSRGIADMITSGKGFADQLKNIFRETANSIIRILLEAVFAPFQKWLVETIGGIFKPGGATSGGGVLQSLGGLSLGAVSGSGGGGGMSATSAAGQFVGGESSFLGVSGKGGAILQAAAVTGGLMAMSDAFKRGGKAGMMEGAAGGAAAGAAIGSVIPGVGTAIGAAVGAAAGFLAGLFGGGERRRQEEARRREAMQAQYLKDAPGSASRTGIFGSSDEYDVEAGLMGKVRAMRKGSVVIAPTIVIKQINPEDLDPVQERITRIVSTGAIKGWAQMADNIGYLAGR